MNIVKCLSKKIFSKWKEAAIGTAIAVLLILSVDAIARLQRVYTSPSNFMVVSSVSVPDHTVGENPLVVYDFTVQRPFYGNFSVEVLQSDDYGTVTSICRGSGSKFYTPEQLRTPIGQRTLSWYINRNCHLQPGTYRLLTNWLILPDNYPAKSILNITEPFQVLSKE